MGARAGTVHGVHSGGGGRPSTTASRPEPVVAFPTHQPDERKAGERSATGAPRREVQPMADELRILQGPPTVISEGEPARVGSGAGSPSRSQAILVFIAVHDDSLRRDAVQYVWEEIVGPKLRDLQDPDRNFANDLSAIRDLLCRYKWDGQPASGTDKVEFIEMRSDLDCDYRRVQTCATSLAFVGNAAGWPSSENLGDLLTKSVGLARLIPDDYGCLLSPLDEDLVPAEFKAVASRVKTFIARALQVALALEDPQALGDLVVKGVSILQWPTLRSFADLELGVSLLCARRLDGAVVDGIDIPLLQTVAEDNLEDLGGMLDRGIERIEDVRRSLNRQ